MSAPLLLIGLPILAAILVFFIYPERPRLATFAAAGILMLLAWWSAALPLDAPVSVFFISIPVYASLNLMGRALVFDPSMRPALWFLFLSASVLFLGSLAIPKYRRFLCVGLVVQSLFTASLLVRPFLYAAILLPLAVTSLSLILSDPSHPSPRGAMRWIAFSALGMPFLLLAGSELAAHADLPLDPIRFQPILLLLAIGFALFLAFPPFHFWLPDVADDSPPYSVAFILSVYLSAVIFFLLRFLDSYSWLRASATTYQVLQLAGGGFCVVGGLFSIIQNRYGRTIGYASMINLGAILFCLSVPTPAGVQTAMVLLMVRSLTLAVWGISFHAIRSRQAGDSLNDLRGRIASQPISSTASLLAGLSLVGLPGLFAFPAYWSTLQVLASTNIVHGFVSEWPTFILLSSMVFGTVACLRFARTILESPILLPLPPEGGRIYQLVIGVALAAFFLLGVFPQLFIPWIANSAHAFTNLMSSY